VLKAFVPLPNSDMQLPRSTATGRPTKDAIIVAWNQDLQILAELFNQMIHRLVDLSQLLNDQVHLRRAGRASSARLFSYHCRVVAIAGFISLAIPRSPSRFSAADHDSHAYPVDLTRGHGVDHSSQAG